MAFGSNNDIISIQIGRLGSLETIRAKDKDSLKKILDDNNYSVGENENVYLNGDKINKKDLVNTIPSKNSVIILVGAKEGGIFYDGTSL